MLRLEKGRQEIHVRLRDRPRHLDRAFLIALGIALTLHATAALLFYIKPFILSNDAVLSPIVVEAELPQAEEGNITVALLEKSSRRYALEPIYATLQLPQLSSHPVKQQVEYHHPADLLNPFKNMETDWQKLLNGPIQQKTSPLTIAVAGPLASRQRLDESERAFTTLSQTGTVLYTVRVDAKSGQIFWYAPQTLLRQPALERAAEQLLLAMRFAPDPESFVFNGEVAIQFGNVQ